MSTDRTALAERSNFIDVARGFVIILMLIGHSSAPSGVVKMIYGFHMPFFFILSGYLYKKEKWTQLGIQEFIKRKWKVYIIPYFILSFINLLINIPAEYIGSHLSGKELLSSTVHHIFWIFYSWGSSVRMPNCTPLWFLPCIFICGIYLYFLLKVNSVFMRWILCVFAVALDYLLYRFHMPQLPWHLDIALLGMVFMYIGYVVKTSCLLEKIEHHMLFNASLLIIGFYCISKNAKIDMNPNNINNIVLLFGGAVCVSLAIIIFCYRYVKKSRFLSYMGRNTILIMAFNYAINSYSKVLWKRIPLLSGITYEWWIRTIVDIITCMVIISVWNAVKRKYSERDVVSFNYK